MALSEQHVIPCKKFMGYFHGKKKVEYNASQENNKSPGQKNLWNQINQFDEMFFSNIFHRATVLIFHKN